MKEKEFISIIKNITKSKFIGDDCAFLQDLGIVISQDNLVENIHFSMDYFTPFELGFKSAMVNISDICASGAIPKYITVGLSMPKTSSISFVEDFYKGCQKACGDIVEIIGGDLTASEKIMISICAIGLTNNRNISSRSNAQIGQKIVVSGVHGSSAAGLELLQQGIKFPQKLVQAHIAPIAQIDFSNKIAQNTKTKYAMMDTSDGLMDALLEISNSSGVGFDIDFDKIPIDNEILQIPNWQDYVLFGGEDYKLVATVEQDFDIGIKIGNVIKGQGVNLKINGKNVTYTKDNISQKLFNHFS